MGFQCTYHGAEPAEQVEVRLPDDAPLVLGGPGGLGVEAVAPLVGVVRRDGGVEVLPADAGGGLGGRRARVVVGLRGGDDARLDVVCAAHVGEGSKAQNVVLKRGKYRDGERRWISTLWAQRNQSTED